jgi:acetyl esterase/lipase
VRAMRERGLPVTYIVYPDEGHGFARPENRTAFNAITEAFFAEHLGGRCEPIGNDLAGSSLQVLEGIDAIAGLAQAVESTEQDVALARQAG